MSCIPTFYFIKRKQNNEKIYKHKYNANTKRFINNIYILKLFIYYHYVLSITLLMFVNTIFYTQDN